MNPFCGVTLLSVLLLSFLVRKHPPALLFDALGAVEDVEEPQGGPEDNGQNPGNAACALVFGNGGFQIQVFGAAVAQGLEDIVEQVVGIDRAVGLTHHQLVLNSDSPRNAVRRWRTDPGRPRCGCSGNPFGPG